MIISHVATLRRPRAVRFSRGIDDGNGAAVAREKIANSNGVLNPQSLTGYKGVGESKSLQLFHLKTDGPLHANFREIERGVFNETKKSKENQEKRTKNREKKRQLVRQEV